MEHAVFWDRRPLARLTIARRSSQPLPLAGVLDAHTWALPRLLGLNPEGPVMRIPAFRRSASTRPRDFRILWPPILSLGSRLTQQLDLDLARRSPSWW